MKSQQQALDKLTAEKEAALQSASQQAALTLESNVREHRLAMMVGNRCCVRVPSCPHCAGQQHTNLTYARHGTCRHCTHNRLHLDAHHIVNYPHTSHYRCELLSELCWAVLWWWLCIFQEAKAAWDKEKAALEKQQVEALLAIRLTAQQNLEQERRQWQQERDDVVQRSAAQQTAVELQVSTQVCDIAR